MKTLRPLSMPRDHLVHVLPRLEVNGCYMLALTLAQQLQKEYAHTLLYEGAVTVSHPSLLWQAQSAGMYVENAEELTPELLDSGGYTGAILYNVEGHHGLGRVVPTVYYSYGVYDPVPGEDVIVACSKYACFHRRYEKEDWARRVLNIDLVVPPMIQSRGMRRLKADKRRNFIVGVFTGGSYNKFPSRLVMQLASKLPNDIGLLVTRLPKYPHPGVQLALEERQKRRAAALCPLLPYGTIRYLTFSNVVVIASKDSHFEPYGRTAVEAMALGKPVLCENKGVFPEVLEHGVNALLFDDVDEVLEHIKRIRADTEIAAKLGANAQMWASWQDVAVHIGKLKRTLRMIGV